MRRAAQARSLCPPSRPSKQRRKQGLHAQGLPGTVKTIGPSTGLPVDLVRPDVLLCLGEEEDEFEDALDRAGLDPAPLRSHHRSFHGRVRNGILCLDGALGSALVEKCIWELSLTGKVQRILLVGTAGSLEGFSGEPMLPYLATPAVSVFQNFDPPPNAQWLPSWELDMPRKAIVTCDRFFGFSSLIDSTYPAEPSLQAAWQRYRGQDMMLDMEVAAFYHYCQSFGPPDLLYAAIKAVANPVWDLDALPENSPGALRACVRAGVDAIQATG